jgi:hypothetical protein
MSEVFFGAGIFGRLPCRAALRPQKPEEIIPAVGSYTTAL